jgi:hypothetical protein
MYPPGLLKSFKFGLAYLCSVFDQRIFYPRASILRAFLSYLEIISAACTSLVPLPGRGLDNYVKPAHLARKDVPLYVIVVFIPVVDVVLFFDSRRPWGLIGCTSGKYRYPAHADGFMYRQE